MPYGYTPYLNIRFPLSGNVIDATEIQNMASDMNTVLTNTNTQRVAATRRSGVTLSALSSTQTIAKNTQTIITYASPARGPLFDNGATGGVGATAYWSSGSPTRITVPAGAGGIYLAKFYISLTGWSNNATNRMHVSIGRNGSFVAPDLWEAKTNNTATNWQIPDPLAVQTLMLLTAGDFIQSRVLWNGGPAGPLSISSGLFSLQQIAV